MSPLLDIEIPTLAPVADTPTSTPATTPVTSEKADNSSGEIYTALVAQRLHPAKITRTGRCPCRACKTLPRPVTDRVARIKNTVGDKQAKQEALNAVSRQGDGKVDELSEQKLRLLETFLHCSSATYELKTEADFELFKSSARLRCASLRALLGEPLPPSAELLFVADLTARLRNPSLINYLLKEQACLHSFDALLYVIQNWLSLECENMHSSGDDEDDCDDDDDDSGCDGYDHIVLPLDDFEL